MSEYIYSFLSVGENKVQEWLVRLSLEPQILLWKTGKSNIWLLSAFNCPCAQSDKSKLESKRVSLWSGSISSTATRPAFWPGSTGTHVMPQLHKRFSFPPDKLVTVSDIPSVRQTHPATLSEHRKSVKNVLINPPFQFSTFTFVFQG